MKNTETQVFALVCDCGDGGSFVAWFKNEKLVNHILDNNIEGFQGNEGIVPAYTFPSDFDFNRAGIRFVDKYHISLLDSL